MGKKISCKTLSILCQYIPYLPVQYNHNSYRQKNILDIKLQSVLVIFDNLEVYELWKFTCLFDFRGSHMN